MRRRRFFFACACVAEPGQHDTHTCMMKRDARPAPAAQLPLFWKSGGEGVGGEGTGRKVNVCARRYIKRGRK